MYLYVDVSDDAKYQIPAGVKLCVTSAYSDVYV